MEIGNRIFFWVHGTLFNTGSTHIVTREVERYGLKLNIVETRWQEIGSLQINNDTVFFEKYDNQRQFGTGFIVDKSLVPSAKELKSFNPRISVLAIKAHWFYITLVNVHSPLMKKTQEEKDNFCGEFENLMDTVPDSRLQIIIGDLNTKIGK